MRQKQPEENWDQQKSTVPKKVVVGTEKNSFKIQNQAGHGRSPSFQISSIKAGGRDRLPCKQAILKKHTCLPFHIYTHTHSQ